MRLIGHEESFEVRYSHGRPSKYFYFDEHPRDLGGLLFRTRPPPKPDSPPLRLLIAFARNQSASSISNTIAFSLSRANGREKGLWARRTAWGYCTGTARPSKRAVSASNGLAGHLARIWNSRSGMLFRAVGHARTTPKHGMRSNRPVPVTVLV